MEKERETEREPDVASLLVECERQASVLDTLLEQCVADAGRHSLDPLLLTVEELIEVRRSFCSLVNCSSSLTVGLDRLAIRRKRIHAVFYLANLLTL